MSWFHPEEASQVGVLMAYEDEHPGTRYLIEFPDGESYICTHFAEWESENTGELDIEMDDPRYDEFYQIGMDIVQTIKSGKRRYEDALPLDYRDFPSRITDLDTGTIVYPAGEAT